MKRKSGGLRLRGEGREVVLDGEHQSVTLGRGTLERADPRCSRAQVEVSLVSSGAAGPSALLVTPSASAPNPSHLLRASDAQSSPLVSPVEAMPGDVLYLLKGLYPFTVEQVHGPCGPDDATAAPQEERSGKRRGGVGGGSWADELGKYTRNPERFPESVVLVTEDVVVIKDAFPKARLHLLAMPRGPDVPSGPLDLTSAHVEVVKKLLEAAREAVARVSTYDSRLAAAVRYGFHRVPSMRPLHLHAISQDFQSPCLKTPKHWQSFTTEFFVPAGDVLDMLQQQQGDRLRTTFARENEAILKRRPMRCHRCGCTLGTMPQVKSHISTCLS